MKKLLVAMALCGCCFSGIAQDKVTAEQAKSITANVMANFTMSCSFAYTKGVTLEGFKRTLCGPATPLAAGDVMIKSAYTYLSQGVTKDQIIKTNDGKAVAGAFQFFLDQHNRGVYSDGTEIFGSREILAKSTVAREGGCRWYQFWCHVEVFANWVVANWEVIQQILVFVLNL